MSKKLIAISAMMTGCILLVVGALLGDKVNTGLCIGIGCGFIGGGVVYYMELRMGEKDPTWKKAKDIEVNDERNQFIRAKAGSTASTVMFYMLCAISLLLNLFDVDTMVYIGIAALLLVQGIAWVGAYSYFEKRV